MTALPSEAAGPPPPSHIAIIMDGNGRWAAARGLPRAAGHREGAEAVRRTLRAAAKLGVRYLTLYGFSSENWKRPPAEVDDLMGLLRLYLRREIAELHSNGVRLLVIGDRTRLAPDIVSTISEAEEQTRNNTRLTLIMALSYGGRAEIAAAAAGIARDVAEGRLSPGDVDETLFGSRLLTVDIPDPDLLIRTSGEQRVSNFLLWQIAYSELVFTGTLWPDFDEAELVRAVDEYHGRERRYGSIG